MNKDKQILIRLTKEEKELFKIYCQKQDETMQRIIRKFIKTLISK